jgi:hypothetical protein
MLLWDDCHSGDVCLTCLIFMGLKPQLLYPVIVYTQYVICCSGGHSFFWASLPTSLLLGCWVYLEGVFSCKTNRLRMFKIITVHTAVATICIVWRYTELKQCGLDFQNFEESYLQLKEMYNEQPAVFYYNKKIDLLAALPSIKKRRGYCELKRDVHTTNYP